jgi:hypothetical protein
VIPAVGARDLDGEQLAALALDDRLRQIVRIGPVWCEDLPIQAQRRRLDVLEEPDLA